MRTEAYLSEDRKYRYWLLRVWNEALPLCAIFGVNPSTADEKTDDHTIRKDIGFSSRHGCGGILKLNVGAYRATDPREWRKCLDPIGPENTVAHLRQYLDRFKPSLRIAAWGKNGAYQPRQCAAIRREVEDLWCFGCNPDGTPRHTLTLPYSTPLMRFSPRSFAASPADAKEPNGKT